MRCTLLTVVGLVGLAMAAGCNRPTEQQRLWLAEGERAYKQKHYDRAIQKLSLFIDNASERPELGRALYVRALAHARSDQRTQARSDLTRCVESSRDPDVRWRAYAVLGTLDYEESQWAAAARSYAAAVADAPRVPPTDALLFRLGVCYERCGRWEAAREPYKRLLVEYPASNMRDAARRRLDIHPEHFAIQCGVFADRRNADRLVLDLQRQGMTPHVRREPRNRIMMFVVLVGHYVTYEEALRDLARVKGYVPDAVLWP